MGAPPRLPFLLASVFAWLLLSVSARPGASVLNSERSGVRKLLQDEEPEPCLFLNGRIIPPCPQLDEMPSTPDPKPETSPSPQPPKSPAPSPTPPKSPAPSPTPPKSPAPSPSPKPSPSTKPPAEMVMTNLTAVLDNCSFNGSLFATQAAIEGCTVVEEECVPTKLTAFSSVEENTTAMAVNKIAAQACRTEAIATCSKMAFTFVPQDCKDLLENGPAEPQDACAGVRQANEIFESTVSLYCEEELTPEEEGN